MEHNSAPKLLAAAVSFILLYQYMRFLLVNINTPYGCAWWDFLLQGQHQKHIYGYFLSPHFDQISSISSFEHLWKWNQTYLLKRSLLILGYPQSNINLLLLCILRSPKMCWTLYRYPSSGSSKWDEIIYISISMYILPIYNDHLRSPISFWYHLTPYYLIYPVTYISEG